MSDKAVLWIALTPKTGADDEKLANGLAQLMAEDPVLRVRSDRDTGEVIISCANELHLEMIVDRLKRDFHVEARVGRPQVAYKEALTRPADGEMKYVLQTGGMAQYAHAKIHLYPGEAGTGYVFEDTTTGGTIPEEFINPIQEEIRGVLTRGVVAGYPVEDVRIELYDGSYHDVDSSEMAFRIAGALAFRDAAMKAGPVLLEPVMRVEVVVPTEHLADVVGNLASRRGRIQLQEVRDSTQTIVARVPLATLFGYSMDLRDRTRGTGTFHIEFDRYEPCPPADPDDSGRDAFVRAPRTPSPTLRDSGIALPEPDGHEQT